MTLSSVDKLFRLEQLRMIGMTCVSPVLGYFTPTGGFIMALVLMFGFNVWCGMRADGVSVLSCRRFSFRKFKNALMELFLYLFICELIYSVMYSCGDGGAGLLAVKSLSYVIMYVYLQNSFRNLIKAYPDKIALRMIYHLVRFEFSRAMPSYLREIVDRVERERNDNV